MGRRWQALGQIKGALLVRDDVFAEEQAAVFHAMDVFRHLTFAAAAGAFVHENELVLIGRDDGDGCAMVSGPAFALADVEEHGVDAFFRARAGIEVVGEDFLMRDRAVVDDELAAAEVVWRKGGATKRTPPVILKFSGTWLRGIMPCRSASAAAKKAA